MSIINNQSAILMFLMAGTRTSETGVQYIFVCMARPLLTVSNPAEKAMVWPDN